MRHPMLLMLAAAVWTHTAARPASAQSATANGPDYWAIPPALETPSSKPAYKPSDVRVIVSVEDRRLWVVAGDDTLRSATVSVASGRELAYAGRRWRFATPRGALRIRGKRTDPVWLPPDWHYAEVASTHGLGLRSLTGSGVRLANGSRLVVRDSIVGVLVPGDTTFHALPVDEHIVFQNTLFIPPVNTLNRRLAGELGKYALDLGNGYLLHGTPDQSSVGRDTTHGCIRLADEDLEWLYQHVPVGATVQVR